MSEKSDDVNNLIGLDIIGYAVISYHSGILRAADHITVWDEEITARSKVIRGSDKGIQRVYVCLKDPRIEIDRLRSERDTLKSELAAVREELSIAHKFDASCPFRTDKTALEQQLAEARQQLEQARDTARVQMANDILAILKERQ